MPGPEIREASPSVVIIDDDDEFRDSVVRALALGQLGHPAIFVCRRLFRGQAVGRTELSGARRENAGAKRSGASA